jgi:hypothetical protein
MYRSLHPPSAEMGNAHVSCILEDDCVRLIRVFRTRCGCFSMTSMWVDRWRTCGGFHALVRLMNADHWPENCHNCDWPDDAFHLLQAGMLHRPTPYRALLYPFPAQCPAVRPDVQTLPASIGDAEH